jgi:Uma2 family endonuclease
MATLVIRTENVHVVAGPPQGRWTYADWERLPDDGNRYEVIEGVLYMSKMRSAVHQQIILQILSLISYPMRDQELGDGWPQPIQVVMPGCAPVQPDCAVLLASYGSLLRNGIIQAAPNIIIEVMASPGSEAYYKGVKLEAYALAGVEEYAVIDLVARTLNHYRLNEDEYGEPQVFGEGGTMTFHALPSITVPIAQLFAGAPDTTLRIADV